MLFVYNKTIRISQLGYSSYIHRVAFVRS